MDKIAQKLEIHSTISEELSRIWIIIEADRSVMTIVMPAVTSPSRRAA